MTKYLMLATISLPVVLSGTFALAHGSGTAGRDDSRGMQGCVQMMQGMKSGADQPPNQQWRRRQMGPGGERLGPEPRGRSSPE